MNIFNNLPEEFSASDFEKCPRFIYHEPSEEMWPREDSDIEECLSEKLNILPFPVVKITLKRPNGKKDVNFWLSQSKEDAALFAMIEYVGFSCGFWADEPKKFSLSFVALDGEETDNPEAIDNSWPLMNVSWVSICWFIRESMLSGNFIAATRPKPRSDNPKHVEWSKSQEHYVIIHRSSNRNKSDAQSPSPASNITRMAHTRRAHLRRLNSGRYAGNPRIVIVRSCWVGPPEWTHNGSIYKMELAALRQFSQ